ncbi:MAG: hypothetical protein DRO96_02720 [Candidatus Aenigmatarchaeota archaeon]|nr:MAG: hypothetical protein DRO96_02720 [Candidatus Aenigmarchaeota archaeon]
MPKRDGKEEQKKVKIILDSRERLVKQILANYDCVIEERQLPVGDFVLSDRVLVERKTAADFVQSILDGRLFNQLVALRQVQRPILILEGEKFNERITKNALRGALGSIAIDYQIPILWTKDVEETTGLVYQIAKREQLVKKREVSIRVKRKFRTLEEAQEFLVAGLPSVSTTLARRLLEKLKTPEKVFTASDEELKEVHGIGSELVARFKKILKSEYKRKKERKKGLARE